MSTQTDWGRAAHGVWLHRILSMDEMRSYHFETMAETIDQRSIYMGVAQTETIRAKRRFWSIPFSRLPFGTGFLSHTRMLEATGDISTMSALSWQSFRGIQLCGFGIDPSTTMNSASLNG